MSVATSRIASSGPSGSRSRRSHVQMRVSMITADTPDLLAQDRAQRGRPVVLQDLGGVLSGEQG